jgi:hypothetical protein
VALAFALTAAGCALDSAEASPEVASNGAELASPRTMATEPLASRVEVQGRAAGIATIGRPRLGEAPALLVAVPSVGGDGDEQADDPRPHPWQPPPDRSAPRDDVPAASAGSESGDSTK